MIAERLSGGRLVYAADLAGTCVFAAEGAIVAMRGGLDFFGVIVLSFATALGGGIIRDVLLGAAPPQALRDRLYAAIAIATGTAAYLFHWWIVAIPSWIVVGLDAAGLGLFAVAGTQKALDYGMRDVVAVLMGTITAVGGGTIRDVLLAQVPAVLRTDVYATAAVAGAVILVAGRALGAPASVAACLGGFVCFGLRMLAVWQHWVLPHVTIP